MPTELVQIEEVKRGAFVVDSATGVPVLVKSTKKDGEDVVLEVGLTFCVEIRRPGGSVVSVWRRQRRRKERKEDGE
jgi:hypothetical protein